MPLLSPNQIHEVLNESKRLKKSEKRELPDLLDNASLSKEEILENLASLMRSAETDSTRLRAAETGLKLHGCLDTSETRSIPTVNIIINDSQFSVNPILIPR